MPYQIRLGEKAQSELSAIRTNTRRRIVDVMRREPTHHPASNRPPRKRVEPDPESGIAAAPVWRLRVGDYRVFYDVDSVRRVVMVQRIVFKGRLTTREALE